MNWTNDQKNAIEHITEFKNSEIDTANNNHILTLSGFAGTGKTTVIKNISAATSGIKIAVSAPTHKAKNIIATLLNRRAETIQSLLGLRPNIDIEDFNPNKPIFAIVAEEKIKNYDFVIIDEASMLNKASVELLESKSKEYNTKLLYVGDVYQLPPIKELLSNAFNYNTISLNEIVRQQNDNPNIELINISRNDVINKTNNLIPFIKSTPILFNTLEEGYEMCNRDNFIDKMLKYFLSDDYKNTVDFAVILCWTNRLADSLSLKIRNIINPNKEIIAIDDKVIAKKTVSINTPLGIMILIENSMTYKVIDSYIDTLKFRFVVYVVKLENNVIINVLHPSSYEAYSEYYNNLLVDAQLTRRWQKFYSSTQEIVLMEDLYYKGKLLISAQLSYAYAITVHKSQGSTYKHVGVVISELVQNTKPEGKSLIYVALSRATTTNIIT